ncbi:serine/threonine-protein kinase [Nocardioides sp. WS12]|uniref:serine/threonine-protein kinase n=1 Tax=Nocardioides sp. WS12 TaxID=2486272 RepID=UPI0023513F54|nr:serine/threonine-protein kinase [Nocardioides sp. WS12]
MGAIPAAGDTFGRYRIEGTLGQGGMGVVLRARQIELDRVVALKLMLPEVIGADDRITRFRGEAMALGRLESPHVVQVYDAGEHDGWLYIATQLIPDGDVANLLAAQGPLGPSAALGLVDQVLSGLADAHAVGLIHRDVKPSNVLLRRETAGPRAFLCDFGISQVMDSTSQTVGVIGTWAYLAPERLRGAAATVQSDLYAVGCLLWELLTGTAPYTGTMPQLAIAHEASPLPQAQPTGPWAAAVNQVLVRAMAKQPQHRFASAIEMQAAVRDAATRAHQAAPAEGGTPIAQVGGASATVFASSAPVISSPPPPPPSYAAPSYPVAFPGAFPVAPSVTPAPRGKGKVLAVIAACVLAVALGVGGAVALVQLTGDDDPATAATDDVTTGPADNSPGTDTPVSAGPTDEPTSPAAPAPVGDVTCWDGSQVVRVSNCDPRPSGQAGMTWVFPSMKDQDCTGGDLTGDRAEVWSCSTPFNGEEVRLTYTRWDSVKVARSAFEAELGSSHSIRDPEDTEAVFDEWIAPGRGGHVFVRLFVGFPYSVEVESTIPYDGPDIAIDGFDDNGAKLVRFRPHRKFAGQS